MRLKDRVALVTGMAMGIGIGLTRQMAAEYAPQEIRVNCIAPGNVDTPQSNKVLD